MKKRRLSLLAFALMVCGAKGQTSTTEVLLETTASSQPPIPTTVPFRTSASSAPQSSFQRSTLQFLKRFAQLVGTRRALRAATDAL